MEQNDTKFIISGDFNELIKNPVSSVSSVYSASSDKIKTKANSIFKLHKSSIGLKLELKTPDKNTCCFTPPNLKSKLNTYTSNQIISYLKASLFFYSNNINIYESDVGNVKLSDHEPFIVNFN